MANRKNNVSDDQIVSAYAKIKNGNRVALELGISDKTTYSVLKRHGIATTGLQEYRARIKVFKTPEAIQDIVRKHLAGLSASEVARQHGCSTITVLDALRTAGIEVKSKPRLSTEEKRKAMELYDGGMTLKKVSQAIGRSEATITRFLHDEHAELVRLRYRSGALSPMWKGGRIVHRGYVYVLLQSDDPMRCMANLSGYVLEHRLVLARKLGRPLHKGETVHHINGDHTDNADTNLQLRNGRHGNGVVLRCLDCGSHNIGPVGIADPKESPHDGKQQIQTGG